MTPKTITLADDVREQLEQRAAAEGKDLDELANDAMRAGLEKESWAAFIAKGRAYGAASGIKPEDLEQVREDFRSGQ